MLLPEKGPTTRICRPRAHATHSPIQKIGHVGNGFNGLNGGGVQGFPKSGISLLGLPFTEAAPLRHGAVRGAPLA